MNKKFSPIHLIRASAGTGKTFRLATEYSNYLSSDVNCGASLSHSSETIAATFTNKAASELVHRIRRFLLRADKWDTAQALFVAPIGTVNSVCGSLVADLAIEVGLSPSIKVIPEEQQNEVFYMAVEEVLNSHSQKLWSLLYRMKKLEDRNSRTASWRDDVIRIVDIARQNNIDPESLVQFGETSWRSLQALLPECNDSASPDLFDELKKEIKDALHYLPAEDDATKVTINGIATLNEICQVWNSMDLLSWDSVASIAKIKVGKKSQPHVDALIELAAAHPAAPQYHADIEALVRGVFSCAADCLVVYKDYKAERGLIDFVDQERLALAVLQDQALRPALDGRFKALLVDEFQDTSPIQLAIFLELAQLVEKSIWVGDEKQSIFGFRGSDPVLMQTVVEKLVPLTGGSRDNLAKSYRSRPKLVNFVNQVFSDCLQPLGFSLTDIEILETNRVEESSMNSAIHLWWTGSGNQQSSIEALANEILQVLLHPEGWPVANYIEGGLRKIRGSDIAILCRSNSRRLEIADALSKLGIIAATERSGLLKTPECVFAIAVLRFLVDRYDTLAIAEILRFSDTSEDQKAWLVDWLQNGGESVLNSNEDLRALVELRHELLGLTPVESLQLATTAPLVLSTILRWGNQRQRLLNLDALIGVAITYEEFCVTCRETASTAGLIAFLSSKSDALQSANPDEQAVQVLTYHKAKGLEWPMVIMFDLDVARPANPFGAHVENSKDCFDAQNPLLGRTIRYWPWPYGAQTSGLSLVAASVASKEMADVSSQRDAEYLRLLYVGMTRPRDYLILACRETAGGTAWLDIAKDTKGESVFNLSPGVGGMQTILRNSPSELAACRLLEPCADTGSSSPRLLSSAVRYEHDSSAISAAIPSSYSCAPSSLHMASDAVSAVEVDKQIDLGSRLPFVNGTDMRSLGEALHQFFAIDDYSAKLTERLRRAASVAESHKIEGLNPASFVEASNRLNAALDELYPDAVWLREWSVTGRYGAQRMSGAIDLLLELSEGYVIIDHKSFPGSHDLWCERALSHYAQLDAYGQLVRQATGKEVIASYIHMPIVGGLLSLKAVGPLISEQLLSNEEQSWLVF